MTHKALEHLKDLSEKATTFNYKKKSIWVIERLEAIEIVEQLNALPVLVEALEMALDSDNDGLIELIETKLDTLLTKE